MEERENSTSPVHDEEVSNRAAHTRPGWHSPRPEEVPRPTYCPAVMALGIVFLLWGVVTTFWISGIGMVLFGLALAMWIRELRDEHRQFQD
jgi:hypothetical protein